MSVWLGWSNGQGEGRGPRIQCRGGVGGLVQAEIPLKHLSGLCWLDRRVYSLGSSLERRAGTHGHRILLGGKGYEDALHEPGDTAPGSENAESYRPRGRQTLGDEG